MKSPFLSFQGMVYYMGGYKGHGTPLGSVEVLDLKTGRWSLAGDLAVNRWGLCGTLVPRELFE